MGDVPNQTLEIGANVTVDVASKVTLTDGDPIITYYVTCTTPANTSFTMPSATGIFQGPVDEGVYHCQATAEDKDGLSNIDEFSIRAVPPSSGGPDDICIGRVSYDKRGFIGACGNFFGLARGGFNCQQQVSLRNINPEHNLTNVEVAYDTSFMSGSFFGGCGIKKGEGGESCKRNEGISFGPIDMINNNIYYDLGDIASNTVDILTEYAIMEMSMFNFNNVYAKYTMDGNTYEGKVKKCPSEDNADDICYANVDYHPLDPGGFCGDFFGLMQGGFNCVQEITLRNLSGDDDLTGVEVAMDTSLFSGNFFGECGIEDGEGDENCTTSELMDFGPVSMFGNNIYYELEDIASNTVDTITEYAIMSMSMFNGENLHASYVKNGHIYSGKIKPCPVLDNANDICRGKTTGGCAFFIFMCETSVPLKNTSTEFNLTNTEIFFDSSSLFKFFATCSVDDERNGRNCTNKANFEFGPTFIPTFFSFFSRGTLYDMEDRFTVSNPNHSVQQGAFFDMFAFFSRGGSIYANYIKDNEYHSGLVRACPEEPKIGTVWVPNAEHTFAETIPQNYTNNSDDTEQLNIPGATHLNVTVNGKLEQPGCASGSSWFFSNFFNFFFDRCGGGFFNLFGGGGKNNTCFDWVTITNADGQTSNKLCGDISNITYEVAGSHIDLLFHSDDSKVEHGASVTISSVAVDAVDDFYSTPKNTTLIVGYPGAFANDKGTDLRFVSFTPPSKGTITSYDPNEGTFTYVPDTGLDNVDDTLTYTMTDKYGATDTATVHIHIGTDTEYCISCYGVVTINVSCIKRVDDRHT